MNATEEMISASGLLSALMGDNPRLLLMRAVAWLDPNTLMRGQASSDTDIDYDAEDDLEIGLQVCRECFPSVYAGIVQLQWQYADVWFVRRSLLAGIKSNTVTP